MYSRTLTPGFFASKGACSWVLCVLLVLNFASTDARAADLFGSDRQTRPGETVTLDVNFDNSDGEPVQGYQWSAMIDEAGQADGLRVTDVR
ncbi:MAG: hypothetical protein MK538_08715, partial [Planctomycetes bacterium]|nr:hypothetical protein [Planctomycetota bacterium]